MELEHYGRRTCSKLLPSSHDTSIFVSLVNKLDRRRRIEFLIARSTYRESRVRNKVREGGTCIFGDTTISLQHSKEGSLRAKNQLYSFSRFDTIPT